MKAFEIGINESGQRLDKYLFKLLPAAPGSFIYKMLRKKNIVLNDKKALGNEKTCIGDVVKLYLSDDTIESMRMVTGCKASSPSESRIEIPDIKKDILYQDRNVLLINKKQGVLSQKSKPSDVSMVEAVINYLICSGFINEEQLYTFHPSVVNRLDRNTSGIICAGISLSGSQQLSTLFKERSMKKEYLCAVNGVIKKNIFLKGYLVKNKKINQVRVFDDKPDNMEAEYIETRIFPLSDNGLFSILCVELVTGRSHQIRAHLSSIGHPILGDRKYGNAKINSIIKSKYNITDQCLHSWRMTFPELSGALSGLSKRVIYAPLPEYFFKLIEGEKLSWQHGQEEV